MSSRPPVLILSAGRIPEELESIFGSIPSGLIPINRKPILFWIIDGLIADNFKHIYVTIGFGKEKIANLLQKKYHNSITLIEVDYHKLPGNAVLEATRSISGDRLLVILGDTLIKDKLSKFPQNDSYVLCSRQFLETKRWCMVRHERGKIAKLYDKMSLSKDDSGLSALIGVYFFKQLAILKNIATDLRDHRKIEISEILERYTRLDPIECMNYDSWYDVGHIDSYYFAKRASLQSRFFNHLEFDDLLGTITKTSEDQEKLAGEISWYHQVPPKLSVLTPKIIDYSVETQPFVKMEYVGYPTLAELWLYGELHERIWINIINRLLRILNLFGKYQGNVPLEDYLAMYFNKTNSRVRKAISNSAVIDKLFSSKQVVINKVEFSNWHSLRDELVSKVHDLYNIKDNCFIHGDLCFPNILYDINNGLFKFIDPRGVWGSSSYGDIKYDIAKLRHSIAGHYDRIVNGLFDVATHQNEINLSISGANRYKNVRNYYDTTVGRSWDINQIKFIEGLHFISMMPLHKEDERKQIAFYAMGIARLNEVLRMTPEISC